MWGENHKAEPCQVRADLRTDDAKLVRIARFEVAAVENEATTQPSVEQIQDSASELRLECFCVGYKVTEAKHEIAVKRERER